jgi:hypothetical protein
MPTLPTEITTTLETLLVSTVIYLITVFIQQRTKKNSTLRLIGTIYAPVRYFIEVKYIDAVANILSLSYLFFFIISELLLFLPGSNSGYIIKIKIIAIVFLILGALLYLIYRNFMIKRNKKLKEFIYESSVHSTLDIDSQPLRWEAIYQGTLVLAERYFLLIFIAVVLITSALLSLNKGFITLGVTLIGVYIISFFLSLRYARFMRFLSFGSFYKRLKISFIDTNDEIESRLFNILKDPGICLCIVDDKGNKYCGTLEGITHSVVIRDMDGILVSIPYDHVYRVEGCKVKDDNTGSTLQPYL